LLEPTPGNFYKPVALVVTRSINLAVPLLLLALASVAFSLKPMSVTLDPKGYGTSKTLRVENESSNRVAFEISIVSRDMDVDGQEVLGPATNLFTVFPPQGVILPGQNQSVRLVWKGPAEIPHELCYRIVAEELPVDFIPESGKAQIKILFRYQGTLYVRPRNAKADLRVTSFARSATNNLWQLTVTNAGNAHVNLLNPTLILSGPDGEAVTQATNRMDSIEGENVLPRHSRNFLVPLPAGLTEPAYRARLHVDE
jgi:fimbrial chaperone protein